MKRFLVVAIAIALVATTGTVWAADSNTLAVSANVIGTCKFFSATSTLGFGTLDQNSTADATGTGSTTFWCTKGATATISDTNGLHFSGGKRMQHATTLTEYIPYVLALNASTTTGAGKGTPILLTFNGTITNANYINAIAGNFADTVTIDIIP